MRITIMRIVTCLLAFVLLRSDGAGPDPELIVQQVMIDVDRVPPDFDDATQVLDELDAWDRVGSSSIWSHW